MVKIMVKTTFKTMVFFNKTIHNSHNNKIIRITNILKITSIYNPKINNPYNKNILKTNNSKNNNNRTKNLFHKTSN